MVAIPGVGSFTASDFDAQLRAAIAINNQAAANARAGLASITQAVLGAQQAGIARQRLGISGRRVALEEELAGQRGQEFEQRQKQFQDRQQALQDLDAQTQQNLDSFVGPGSFSPIPGAPQAQIAPAPTLPGETPPTVFDAETSNEARRQAVQGLPFSQLEAIFGPEDALTLPFDLETAIKGQDLQERQAEADIDLTVTRTVEIQNRIDNASAAGASPISAAINIVESNAIAKGLDVNDPQVKDAVDFISKSTDLSTGQLAVLINTLSDNFRKPDTPEEKERAGRKKEEDIAAGKLSEAALSGRKTAEEQEEGRITGAIPEDFAKDVPTAIAEGDIKTARTLIDAALRNTLPDRIKGRLEGFNKALTLTILTREKVLRKILAERPSAIGSIFAGRGAAPVLRASSPGAVRQKEAREELREIEALKKTLDITQEVQLK